MFRRWLFLSALLLVGCAPPAAPIALQPGDTVRPEISVAPKAPWKPGAKIAIGVLARVERPGHESHYLTDDDVPLDRVAMSARVSFLDGERAVGDPLDVPLVHDC